MLNWIMGRKRSVEQIVAPITKIVDDLNSHASFHADKQLYHNEQIDEHASKARAAGVETSKALNTAQKISGLVG